MNESAKIKELNKQLEEKQYLIVKSCEDWAETDTKIKEMAAPHLTQEEIDGDGYSFQGVEEIVQYLINKIEELKQEKERLIIKIEKLSEKIDV